MLGTVDIVTVQGRYFWRNGQRFLVRGVVYQLAFDRFGGDKHDAISDHRLSRLEADLELFKELGINTIFVYSIDVSKSHDRTMRLLEEAGIYVLITAASPMCCINRLSPLETYTAALVQRYCKTLDIMSKYSNTLGVFVANELVNDRASEQCIPVVAALVRDMKQYMRLKAKATGQRTLPIGYSAAGSNERDVAMLDFLTSREQIEAVDFWAFVCYEQFGKADSGSNGANSLVRDISHLNLTASQGQAPRYPHARIPVFMAEYGPHPRPRKFLETRALFSPEMTQTLSGGCVYEFFLEVNNYGLVHFKHDASARSNFLIKIESGSDVVEKRPTDGGELLILKDFFNYKEALTEVKDVEPRTETSNEIVSTPASSYKANHDGRVPTSCVDWEELMKEIDGSDEELK